jgi:hypothetical protein
MKQKKEYSPLGQKRLIDTWEKINSFIGSTVENRWHLEEGDIEGSHIVVVLGCYLSVYQASEKTTLILKTTNIEEYKKTCMLKEKDTHNLWHKLEVRFLFHVGKEASSVVIAGFLHDNNFKSRLAIAYEENNLLPIFKKEKWVYEKTQKN